MTSPFQKSERSSSSRQSTPLRNHPNGDQRVNGYQRSHRDSFDDSPSRQLLEDFGRMLVNDERAFKRSLDEQTAVQQRKHMVALDDALAKHKAVRERAERTRERVELELERERRRREEDEKKAVEQARRDVEEQKLQEQRRQLEDAKVREEERKKQQALSQEQEELKQSVEAQKQREAEHSRRQSEVRKQQEAEQVRRAAQEEAQRAESTRQQAENSQRQQQSAAQQIPASAQQNGVSSIPRSAAPTASTPAASSQAQMGLSNAPNGIVTSTEDREAVHRQYLELHQRLKQMRAQVSEEVKKVQGLKDQLSDWRRAIKKCVGQLMKGSTDEIKRKNRRSVSALTDLTRCIANANIARQTEEIVQHLDAASRVTEPSIDVTQYLVQNHQPPGASTQGPAVLVFLLNHFAKSIVNQFALEGAFESKIADVIGVLAVTVFARPQYLFNGQSLIDLLWAKYHQRCPVLFGISGSERTQAGRMKIGWAMEGGAFVTPDEHYTRMTGLGAGFAALTLRDFSRSKNANPAPNRIYWESMARILNTPASEVSATHCVVLKAMIVNFVPRIIGMFGGAGVAVLRQALIVFPEEKGPQDEKRKKLPSVTALQSMPVLLQRDLHLTL